MGKKNKKKKIECTAEPFCVILFGVISVFLLFAVFLNPNQYP